MGCESKRDKTMAKVNAIINADSPSTAPSRVKLGRSPVRGFSFLDAKKKLRLGHSVLDETHDGREYGAPDTTTGQLADD